jgi:hypothetical protein
MRKINQTKSKNISSQKSQTVQKVQCKSLEGR